MRVGQDAQVKRAGGDRKQNQEKALKTMKTVKFMIPSDQTKEADLIQGLQSSHFPNLTKKVEARLSPTWLTKNCS